MFEAQYLFSKSTTGDAVYSPWMPRQTDNIRYVLDLIQIDNAEIRVELFHKNTEDTGDGSGTGSSIGATATLGRTWAEFSGLKELVRYKFTLLSESQGTLGYALFRMLNPIWFDSVDA